jgi:hypothetical protein
MCADYQQSPKMCISLALQISVPMDELGLATAFHAFGKIDLLGVSCDIQRTTPSEAILVSSHSCGAAVIITN